MRHRTTEETSLSLARRPISLLPPHTHITIRPPSICSFINALSTCHSFTVESIHEPDVIGLHMGGPGHQHTHQLILDALA
mmetsp:Transcript_29942/g.74392  ORF Transcript_29942/g.74392 Transcript_29942/m.74392 type:complete len:80 (-) Transcript_29942:557-796(-)